MGLLGLRLDLKIGTVLPTPAPARLTRALRRVEVTQTDEAPAGFQLTFHAEPSSPGGDYPLTGDRLLARGSRVILSVTVGGIPQVLMDGFITRQELQPGAAPGGSQLTVTGEDVSVKMDAYDISLQYPGLADWLIANLVLVRYVPLGILPVVVPTATSLTPFEYVPQQNETDRAYLKRLAHQYGYSFYIVPGPTEGQNIAYWGPPVRTGAPQPELTTDQGPLRNVDRVSFSYDSLAPAFVYGMALERKVPLPLLIPGTTRLPALATDPPLGSLPSLVTNPLGFLTGLLTFTVRGSLFQHQGRDYLRALALAQGLTDASTDRVVTAEGEVDTVRYGDVLRAPGLVKMRGAGREFDGLYYLQRVNHSMSTVTGAWDYKQSFTLSREGLGSTV